ncbi:glycosyltransferase family 87 protein [Thermoflexus sp.]|uniref:glycosyltransferase family 87 protein n=1 Tax=Thermoflexus sp. TaxID=1969742 RepID=UPI00175B3D09|nr:glycosyltransferase family 87 protein [Thermoflexus sp.]
MGSITRPWTLNEIPPISRLVLAVHLGLALGYIGLVLMAFGRGEIWRADFTAHYTGARMVWEGQGATLYHREAQAQRQQEILGGRHLYNGLLPYNRPPFVAIALSPLAAMSLEKAFAIWALFNLLLWAGFLWDLSRWARPWGAAACALTVSAVAALPGFLLSLLLGTFSIWTLAALWAFYRTLREGGEGWAGFFLALASAHPQAALFPALLLIAGRRWKALAVFLASGLGLATASAAILGSGIWIDYLRMLREAAAAFGRHGIDPEVMINLKGLLARLYPPIGGDKGAWVNGLSALGLAIGAFATLMLWRSPWRPGEPDFDLRFGLTFAMGLFLSPHANPQDGLLIALPGVLVYRFLRIPSGARPMMRQAFEGIAIAFPGLWLAERFTIGSSMSVTLGTIALIVTGCWLRSRGNMQ